MPILRGVVWVGGIVGMKKLSVWGLSAILSYFVGAAVEVGEVEYFSWDWNGFWDLRVGQVRVHGTLAGDSFPAALVDKLSLSGVGKKLKAIKIEGAYLSLLRIAPGIKNYRFFPKRGSGSKAIRLSLSVRRCTLDFFNLPPNLHLQLPVHEAAGELTIDSISIHLNQLKAQLSISEWCWKEKRPPLPGPLRVWAQGTYLKKEDSWSALSLYIEGGEGQLYAQGQLVRWSQLYADFYVNLKNKYLALLLPASIAKATSLVEGIGRWEGDSYEVRLLAAPFQGLADLCLQGKWAAPPYITGKLFWHPYAEIQISGTPAELVVRGESFTAPVCGRFYGRWQPQVPRAHLTFISPQADTLHLTGWTDSARIQGTWHRIPFTAVWDQEHGLSIRVAYAELTSLYEAIRPNSGDSRSFAFPISIVLEHLHAGELGDFQGCKLHLQKGFLQGEAVYLHENWHPFKVRVKAKMPYQHIIAAAESPTTYLYAQYRQDTVWIWGTSVLYDIVGSVAGFVPLSDKRLYLTAAWACTKGGGITKVSGSLSQESVDVQVKGEIPVKDLLDYFPLVGIEVKEGDLEVSVCAQGKWDTILHWDNPTEGYLRLKGVRGFFPALGLPLHTCSAEIAYDPDTTRIYRLVVHAGSFQAQAQATLQHALSYLYTDWRHLRGSVKIEAENFSLREVWRQKKRDTLIPLVRLPTSMYVDVAASLRQIDLLGIHIDRAYVQGALHGPLLSLDSVSVSYREGEGSAWAVLDVSDSTCYLMGGSLRLQNLPLPVLMKELGIAQLPAIRQLGLSQANLSGRLQLSLRFTPELRWYRQSTLWLEAQIFPAVCHTPRFLRWFRPWYLAAYKDTMDFLANIRGASYTDGFLEIPELLLITRIAAFRIQGYHYLFPNSFLYRIQAVRVRRKMQRYAHLERLTLPILMALEQSLGILYAERTHAKTRWHYPLRYAIRRVFFN